MHSLKRIFLLLLIVPFLANGCVLVPFINAAKESGLTEQDRMALLTKEISHYSEAVGWGNQEEVLRFASDEFRPMLIQQIGDTSEEQKLVDAKVKTINFSDSAFRANVLIKIRYYEIPYYIVKNRLENQNWKFSMGSGWKLDGREVKITS